MSIEAGCDSLASCEHLNIQTFLVIIRKALTSNMLGKISSLINLKNLKLFKDKLDPRLYNGAILLGLNSPVVKSHGGTDFIGFANSLKVCEKIVSGNLINKIKDNIN